MPRLLISTGEASGDLQGAVLIRALQRQAQARGLTLEIDALGGDQMAAAGARLLGHTVQIGSVGLVEHLPYIVPTLRLQRQVQQQVRLNPPDLTVLIDYVGFNLALGLQLKRLGRPVIYYIAPQEWVWATANTRGVLTVADRILAIFQQEAAYYAQRGGQVTWVGHPMLDVLSPSLNRASARAQLGMDADRLVVALLPASRHQEIRLLWPALCGAAALIQRARPAAEFWVPLALSQYQQQLEQDMAAQGIRGRVVIGDPRQVIAAADLALAKSGTVNLEIALLGVPQVVIYRVSPLTAWLARRIMGFKIPFMSPVNLVLMEGIVPELLQEAATPTAICEKALGLLTPAGRARLTQDYTRFRQALGEPGASDRAAQVILDALPS